MDMNKMQKPRINEIASKMYGITVLISSIFITSEITKGKAFYCFALKIF